MKNGMLAALWDRRGATAVEYGLICAMIVVAAIGAIVGLGNKVSYVWNNVATEVTTH